MSLADAEGTARFLYESAGFDYEDAVDPSLLAELLLGPGAVRIVPMKELAKLTHSGGRHWIHVSTRTKAIEWIVGHELAHFARHSTHRDRGEAHEEEATCDLVGACLLMPPAAFRRALGLYGPDFHKLAEHFGVGPTMASLRYGEVTGEGIAIVTPHSVHARGEVQITDEEARKLARSGAPGIAVVELGRRRWAVRAG